MKVIVYTKDNCIQCYHTKKFLDDNEIPYILINVTNNEAATNELKEHKFGSLPVVVPGSFDKAWAGFQPDSLEKLVEQWKK
ncbi:MULTISPECIES: glutaredoxin domain-containing protein [unclassified Facklamia]|uniref:glutaredoxin domain-containing protein n=1 Tax=Aerococcaceae TaxID=186827 RepID=UPI0013B918DB|nr:MULTISPECIES: glutaredoxin domain-containing protein [unclassified Facklamia]NEW65293.1 NrdH-redoxin [Facklamia sp. 252]NEW68807.1 NrdH-redoxin [Facklamia sp. 253]QQD66118.1 NrdH-redoxin [Aerococcaceae bacterium zg-252]